MNCSVAAIIVHQDSLLLALRNPGGAIGGLWEFPGGKVDEGESPERALAREVREELGVNADVGELLAEGSFEHRGIPFRLLAYRVTVTSFRFSLSEHSETRWVGWNDVTEMPMPDSDRAVLPEVVRRLRLPFPAE